MSAEVYDTRACALGEGPLWHPLRKQLFWFDITAGKLLSRDADGPRTWSFDTEVSAAGWVDHDTLLIASATALLRFDLRDGTSTEICPLEHTNSVTRSNDGRADPYGGFWIGTMGRNVEPGAGAIYRYYQGELRKLFADITISNAICFAPSRNHAYFTDTLTGCVMMVPLDRRGWPSGAPDVFVDLRADGLNPDGAVTDAEGLVWIAQWGASRVAAYDPAGQFVRAVEVPARHSTCPAFGGEDLSDLYVTSATQGLSAKALADQTTNGMTFRATGIARGLPEPRVFL